MDYLFTSIPLRSVKGSGQFMDPWTPLLKTLRTALYTLTSSEGITAFVKGYNLS